MVSPSQEISKLPLSRARRACSTATGCLLIYTVLQSFSALTYDIQLRRLTPWLRMHVVQQHIEKASLAEKLILPGQYIVAKYYAACQPERAPILRRNHRIPDSSQPAYNT